MRRIAKISGLLSVTMAGLFFCLPALGQGIPTGASWDWQLQAPLDLTVEVDVLGLDPDEVTAAQVAKLKARGVTTICYVSVGTWEEWRDDAGRFPAAVIGKAYDDWPGERFLDVRAPEVLPLMQARFERCAAMGFDAVEPDNIDLNINETGFGLGGADVVRYVRSLSDIAHGLGLLIAQKNAPDLTAELAPFADFALTEDCLADGWCGELAAYPASGRAILAAEYRPATPANCAAGAKLGLSLAFKTADLTRWRQACGD